MASNPNRSEDQLERGDEPHPELTGWEWWPAWHKMVIESNHLRQARLQAVERIIRRSLHDGNPF